MKELVRLLKLRHEFSIAYTPWTIAFAERPNRELKQVLRSLVSEFRLPISEYHLVTPVAEGIINRIRRKNKDNYNPLQLMGNDTSDYTIGLIVKDNKLASVDLSKYYDVSNTELGLRHFEQLAEKFEVIHSRIDSKLQRKLIEDAAQRDARFSSRINFVPGMTVMVARPLSVANSKVKFDWIGPAVIVDMVGHSIALVRYVLRPVDSHGNHPEEEVHICRLALYDSQLETFSDEVHQQVLFDTEEFIVNKFYSVEVMSEGQYGVKVGYRGFTRFRDDVQEIVQLYRHCKKYKTHGRLLSWLTSEVDQKNVLAVEAFQVLQSAIRIPQKVVSVVYAYPS
jgi:hypothetical protein